MTKTRFNQNVITFRVGSDGERSALSRIAARRGLSVSQLLRAAARRVLLEELAITRRPAVGR